MSTSKDKLSKFFTERTLRNISLPLCIHCDNHVVIFSNRHWVKKEHTGPIVYVSVLYPDLQRLLFSCLGLHAKKSLPNLP